MLKLHNSTKIFIRILIVEWNPPSRFNSGMEPTTSLVGWNPRPSLVEWNPRNFQNDLFLDFFKTIFLKVISLGLNILALTIF